MAKTKSGYSASRANYMAELITERLTGRPSEGYINAAMQHGTDTEPKARLAYAFHYNVVVEQIAFVPHPTIAGAGASPDGLVGDDGLIEIKCPSTATHLETLLGAPIDDKYIKQMQFQMACTGRQWCDFVSYDDRLPDHLQFFCKRVHRDNVLIAEMEKEIREFIAEMEAKLAALSALTAH